MKAKKESASGYKNLLQVLENRFEKNMHRHKCLKWKEVLSRLEDQPGKVASLDAMEESGGEPDVIGVDKKTGEFLFADCSPESPKGRRSVCYDPGALLSRKENKPANSALGMAAEMGIRVMNETEYRFLQTLGDFDTKTSSWVETPDEIRSLGGAVFGDRRYNTVFIYHNGAESYYAARGFRGLLKV